MRTTRLIAVLVGLAAIAMVAADASAYYHPGMGTFMSRDPGAGNANRIGAGGPAVGGGFIPRDPTGSNQYADGMNLYQYVGSNPTAFVDPQGLARLQYSYIGVWVSDGKNNYEYADNKATTTFLENDVENLLWKLGVNAWRTGKNMPKNRMHIWSTKITDVGILWDTHYYIDDFEKNDEWSYTGKDARNHYGNADDIIIFVPGYIGWDGKVEKTWGAAHLASSHVIAVPRANYMAQTATTKAIWLAHEVLHHFLPTGWHDTEGIMHPSAESGLSDKLGCKTFEKLKEKGVTTSDVDTNHVIK